MRSAKVSTGAPTSALGSLRNNTAEWWWRDPGMRKLAVAISVGFCGSIAGGYDGSLMNSLMANPRFMASLDHPDANKLGVIAASQTLGSIPGVLPAAWLADRFGRRKALVVGYTIMIAGALVQTFAKGGWNMLAGRFVLGFGSAMSQIAGMTYTAEVAHPRNRPQTTALIQTCFFIGGIAAAWFSFGGLYINSDWSWQFCVFMQVGAPLYVLLCLPFVPESPRWLVSKGRDSEAHEVLARYHANGKMDDELVLYELEEIKEALAFEQASKQIGYMSFFKTRGNRLRLFLLVCIAFMTQWCGNGVISYYLVQILNSVGITNSAQQTGFNGGLQVWNWILAVAGALTTEKFGRRKMWMASIIGMFISYVIITGCSAAYTDLGIASAGPGVLAFIFIFNGSYGIGFTPLAVSYCLEILPFSLRTKGMSIYSFCVMIAIAFNIWVNPIAMEAIAWKYYFVFLGVLIAAFFAVYFLFPETKGRMLEEVAVIFDGEAAQLPAQTHLEDGQFKEDVNHFEHKADLDESDDYKKPVPV